MNIRHTVAVLALVVCGYPATVTAQSIGLANSTSQNWSGGIAGHSGVNYTFRIEFSGFKNDPLPDTIWIGQQPIALSVTDSLRTGGGNTKRFHRKNAVCFEINAGTFHDEYAERYTIHDEKIMPHAPVPYKGVALLSYRIKGLQKYYVIRKIMIVYPPVDYP